MNKKLLRTPVILCFSAILLAAAWYVAAGLRYIIWSDYCNYNAAASEWAPSFALRPVPLSEHIVLESAPDRVVARDSDTGKQIWTSPITTVAAGWYGQAIAGPDHSVYVSTAIPEIIEPPGVTTGRLCALDGANGTVRWVKEGFCSDYLAADDRHVFAGHYSLVALDNTTGRICWKASPPKPDKGLYPNNPPQDGRIVDIVCGTGLVFTTFAWPYMELCAYDAATGKLAWHEAVNEDPVLDPASLRVGNGLVVIACGQCVRAFDSRTGIQKWRFDARQAGEYGACIGSSGRVFVSDKEEGIVYLLDIRSGAIVWTQPLGKHINTLAASDPDGVLYVGTRGNRLYALNSATGRIEWAMPLACFPNNLIGRTYFEVATGTRGFVYAECADDSIYGVHRP